MKKFVSVIKDGAIGMAMGTAVIVPGISAGTIASVFGAFKKIVGAVSGLFKKFWKSLLILLPFGIGAVLAVAGLYIPFQYAFEYCMFAIVCLFAGFILGSLPGVTDKVKGEKPSAVNIVLLVVGFLIAGGIGALSFLTGDNLNGVFENPEWYLYLIVLMLTKRLCRYAVRIYFLTKSVRAT
jgi:putative membrane protein